MFTLGAVLQNRFTRRFRRVCAWTCDEVVLREITDAGYLGDSAIALPFWLARLLYRERPELVAPWEGKMKLRGGR
jgi:hypothetical protein